MRVFRPESWDEFRRMVSAEKRNTRVLWRGQADSEWPLASSFERRVLALNGGNQPGAVQVYPYSTKTNPNRFKVGDQSVPGANYLQSWRDDYREAFERRATGLRGAHPKELKPDEWWALGRHHGLITPLLDWSELPYIAAFFALSGLFDQIIKDTPDYMQGAVVKGSDARKAAVYQLNYGSAFREEKRLRLITPKIDELARWHAQRSICTVLESDEFFELQGFIDSMFPDSELLAKYELPSSLAQEALYDLELHGIGFRTIYPDLTGAALDCNAEYRQKPLYGPAALAIRKSWPGK